MAVTASNTPFPLGAYLGNPDDSNAANQALYVSNLSTFSSLMGAAPAFHSAFINQGDPISHWAGQSQWAATSAAQTAGASSMTPVIALPLSSTASGSASSDAQFQDFAAGKNDAAIQGIVAAWAKQGFTKLMFRPGWEMNIQGPTYAGDDAQSQSNWVKAFQHVYTVLHQAAAANGVSVDVIWNPSVINYTNASATGSLYPGDPYVDVVGADAYSDLHPYLDGGSYAGYHDWHTGGQDATVAQFIADPVNRMHYWTSPAATVWSNDGSNGHSQTLQSLIDFAKAHNKPFAVPETGAGNTDGGVDVADDAAFPQWLAQQLSAAVASGVTVKFVGLWDSNGGGNYEFSHASDGKPQEAAAWAKYFGASQPVTAPVATPAPTPAPTPVVTPTPVTPTVLGTGSHKLALMVSEDAWAGDAQFTVSVDGAQVGGVQTATASHGAGASQEFDVMGSFAAGSHTATLNFLNDAWGGTSSTDRNLYVDGASANGSAVSGAAAAMLSGGPRSFSFSIPTAASTTSTTATASAPDVLQVGVSEDAWQGDAQFTVVVDGAQVGGVRTATASHAAGASQAVSLSGSWGAGAHTVAVSFLNDAWGGSASTDRNLYVDSVSYNGVATVNGKAALLSAGTASFSVTPAAVAPASTTVSLHLAEDAWQGDAQFSASIDGGPVLASGAVSTLNGSGSSQQVDLKAALSAGTHDLAVSFLNDAWGGSASTDRNLYVKGVDVGGTPLAGSSVSLLSSSTSHFQIVVPAH